MSLFIVHWRSESKCQKNPVGERKRKGENRVGNEGN